MIELDLVTPIIPPKRKIWRMFPGEEYKFLPLFRKENVIFLDLPGFTFPAGDWVKSNKLLHHYLHSQRIAEDFAANGANWTPRLEVDLQAKYRMSEARGRILQAIRNLFNEASKGDVVIVPDTKQVGKVYVGVFNDRPADWGNITVPQFYNKTKIPFREVRWLASVDERQLSSGLSKSLRNQNAFTLIERNFYIEILSFAYPRFVMGENHSAIIYNKKDDFTDNESALISFISRTAGAICAKLEEDENWNPRKFDTFSLFLSRPNIEYSCSQTSDIHSPGFTRLVSAKATPLIVASILSILIELSHCDTKQAVAQQIQNIEITNTSAPPEDACTWLVVNSSKKFFSGTDIDIVWKMCKSMRDAQARAGLDPGLTAKIVANPPRRPRPAD